MNILLVAIGGAFGSAGRFLLAGWVGRMAGASPLGTLSVNIIGSFVMGVLAALVLTRTDLARWAPLLMTGFLGGFTTFSAFSLDAVRLWDEARLAALGYVTASVLFSILALLAGLLLGRSLT